jgi:hypothetical protein
MIAYLILGMLIGAAGVFLGKFMWAATGDDPEPIELDTVRDAYAEGVFEGARYARSELDDDRLQELADSWIAEQIAEGNLPAAY